MIESREKKWIKKVIEILERGAEWKMERENTMKSGISKEKKRRE